MELDATVLSGLLAATPDAVVAIDASGSIVYVNDQGLSLFGWPREALVGQPIERLVPERLTAGHRELRAGYVAHPTVRPMGAGLQLCAVRRDGSEFPVEVSLSSLETSEGVLVVAAVRDVTEVRRTEERVRAMLAAAPDALLAVDSSGRIVMANVQAESLFGWSADELIGEQIEMLVPDSVVPRHGALRASYVADPRARPMGAGLQLSGRRHDGSTFPAEVSLNALSEDDGSLLVLAAVRDVTERLRESQLRRALATHAAELESALAQAAASEARYRALVDRAGDAVLLADDEGRYVEANSAAGDLLGVPVDEIIGRGLGDFVENVEQLSDPGAAWKVFREQGEMRGSVKLRRPDGAVRDAEFTATANVAPGLHMSILRDVTERRAAEEDLRRSELQLRQAQRMEAVGQLTGGVAHDFNNLLTIIMGNGELLMDALEDLPEARVLASMTLRAAERGAELTRALLAFARQQALAPRPVDVGRLIAELDSLLRRTLGEDVEIDFVQADGLWPALVDAAQLESTVLNLTLNARDAMPGGGRLTIETSNTWLDAEYAALNPDVDPGQYVLIAVSDTGTGIDPETLTRVFEPFFTTKAGRAGTGLGLSMVYGFVKQSEGHVKIYSEPGEGTTVRIYLPRATAAAAEPGKVHAAPGGGTETVLLVEDDERVRQFAEQAVAALGYRVIAAANGPAALAILREPDDIDLLFTDVVMPGGMSGRELASAALQIRPGLSVLYTSGYTENAIIHQGRLDPGVHLLSKPYKRADLARALREVLDVEWDDVEPAPESNG